MDASLIVPFSEVQESLVGFEAGDLIFAKITPCMENGKGAFVATLPSRFAFGSTEFHVLRPRPAMDGRFLYYFTFNTAYRHFAADIFKESAMNIGNRDWNPIKFLGRTSIRYVD